MVFRSTQMPEAPKKLLAGNSFKKLTGIFVEFNPEGLSRTKKEINIEERKKVIDLLLPKIIQREYDEYSQENEGIIRLARYIRLKKPGIYKKLNKMIDALIDLLGRKF